MLNVVNPHKSDATPNRKAVFSKVVAIQLTGEVSSITKGSYTGKPIFTS